MKKIYIHTIALICFLALGNISRAATIMVQVDDFDFDPSSFTVNVGDTVQWFWTEGFHTTTSTNIPSGAPSWDQPLFNSSPVYSYVITVAGVYNYVCTPHASMGMTGQFTAIGSTGINEFSGYSFNLIKNYISNGQLNFTYALPQASSVQLYLFDITGKQLKEELIAGQNEGIYNHSIDVSTLPKGLYFLNLQSKQAKLTRRIVLD